MANMTSLFFEDEVLPGVLTEIQSDYNYSYGYHSTDWGDTSTVLVLGTAFSGPTNKVIKIYSPEHALYTFGGTYDAKSHKEATLVTGIQDAYDKGCRSIYACRISGSDTYKDFNLAPDVDFKLRVSGKFPSNDNKNIYCRFINNGEELKFVYYKPASRATIYEKMHGMVDDAESTIETTLDLAGTYDYTKETRLADLLNLVNTYQNNNAIQLSIVDKDGNDVTATDNRALNLNIGSIFEGAYFIGRDGNTKDVITSVESHVSKKGSYYYNNGISVVKSLELNTDINAPYPIYGTYDVLRKIFTNITTTKAFDFMSDVEKVDALFTKDSVDYEDVDLSGFELYKALGSGYATTACISLKNPDIQNPTAKDYIVKETSSDNSHRIVAINNGAYSFLQNVLSDYRVLVHGSATENLVGKLPSKKDFLKTVAGSTQVIKAGETDAIVVTPVVSEQDTVNVNDKYNFDLTIVAEDTIPSVNEKMSDVSAKAVLAVSADSVDTITDGDMFVLVNADTYTLCTKTVDTYKDITAVATTALTNKYFYDINNAKLLKFADGALKVVDNTTYIADAGSDKEFFIVAIDEVSCVAKFDNTGITVLGSVDKMLDSETAGVYVVPSLVGSSAANKIILTEDYVTSTSYAMLVDDLNSSALKNRFTFGYAEKFASYADEYLDSDDFTIAPQTTEASDFSVEIYDTGKYIPYKTTDNLARQLAQHCTYTSLKTGSTHGVISYKNFANTSISAIANHVVEACNTYFDLYAKKANGKNMLNKDNMPYDIGKNISVVFGPSYYITSPDGYNYVSSGAAGYAGMVSNLPIDQSSTAQPISIGSLLYELSSSQLTSLTNAGFVTFKNSYTKGIVVTDGITMAQTSSEFRRLSATRIMGAVETIIRAACEPFIGKQNNLPNRNSLKTAIHSALKKLVGTLINQYDFVVVSDSEQQKLGIIDIDYIIVPFYEIRQIRNRIVIRDSID